MKPNLDSLLPSYRERLVPALPGSFTVDVLREIRQRKGEAASSRSWWLDFLDLAMRPSPLAAALSVAIVVSSLVSYAARPAPVFSGPDMGVFSSRTPNLPSGLLGRAR